MQTQNNDGGFPAEQYIRDCRAAGMRLYLDGDDMLFASGDAPASVQRPYYDAMNADPDHREKIYAALRRELATLPSDELARMYTGHPYARSTPARVAVLDADKLAEVEREIESRQRTYASLVRRRRMRPETAERRLAILQEIATDCELRIANRQLHREQRQRYEAEQARKQPLSA